MVHATKAASFANLANRLSVAKFDNGRGAQGSFAAILGGKQQGSQVSTSTKVATVAAKATPVSDSTATTASSDTQAALMALQASAQASTDLPADSNAEPAATDPSSAGTVSAPLGSSTVPIVSQPSDSKPNTAQFMAATGADFKTASSLLYGVIGSNQDLRDWNAIMNSPDPVAAARAATGAMYNSSQNYLSPDATRPQDRPDTTVLAKSGNFVYYKEKIPGLNIDNYVFALVDSNGYQLTSAANSSRVGELAKNFGFDTSAIASMEQQLDAQGISFRGGAWPNGFLS